MSTNTNQIRPIFRAGTKVESDSPSLLRGEDAAAILRVGIGYNIVAIYGCGAAECPLARQRMARSDVWTFANSTFTSGGSEYRPDGQLTDTHLAMRQTMQA
jgi:hypothetical protein